MSLKELKKALTGTTVICSKRTIKLLKQGKVKKVFLSSNCREDIKKRIEYYGSLGNVEIYEIKKQPLELGNLCKKSYAVSVVSVL